MARSPNRTPTAAGAAAAAAAASVGDPTTTTSTAATRGRRPDDSSGCGEGSFATLPACRGLMIALGPSGARAAPNGEREGDDDGDSDRLYLYPQEDADLPDIHPNVRVPRAMTDRPDLLVRYGGGGERG
jgi:hypothetical protein